MGDRLGGGTALAGAAGGAATALAATPDSPHPQPLVDRLHFAPTKEWRRSPLSRSDPSGNQGVAPGAAGWRVRRGARPARGGAVGGGGPHGGLPPADRRGRPRERAARWLFTERVATRGAHVIEQDVELASAVAGDELKPSQPWLPVDPAAEAWADEILRRLAQAQPAVLINPGAGWGAKRWPAERYAAVAQELIDRDSRAGQRRTRRRAAGGCDRRSKPAARPLR